MIGIKAWLIAGGLALAAIVSAYLLGSSRGDTAGYARAKAEGMEAALEQTQQHGRQIQAREAEKKELQQRVDAAEIKRSFASQDQLLKLYPDPKDTSAPVYLPPAMRKVLEGLSK